MSLISTYLDAIIQNLPEWNYQGAKEQENVKEQIESFKLACQQINKDETTNTQLKELTDVIEQYVPDNHISIYKDNKPLRTLSFNHKKENLATNISHIKGVSNVIKIPVKPNECWAIATLKDKSTGLVSIPSFSGNIEDQQEQRRKFVETFFEQKKENKWQHIIFDFRGNTGGDSEIIKEIAERMSGEQVRYADKEELVNTTAAHKKISEGYGLETETHYTSQPGDKFTGSIYVLQDQYNASATEGAIFMLSQLPKAKTIGEKTAGCFAGGATTRLEMPEGTLSIGTVYRERFDKEGQPIKEKEGMHPTLPCAYNKAFDKALDEILESIKRTRQVASNSQARRS